MDYDQIRYEVEDGVAILTLHRPDKMNAFTGEMMFQMINAFDRADADDDVRAVIVTGSGERAFCAGADLSAGGKTFDYDARSDRPDRKGSAVGADGKVVVKVLKLERAERDAERDAAAAADASGECSGAHKYSGAATFELPLHDLKTFALRPTPRGARVSLPKKISASAYGCEPMAASRCSTRRRSKSSGR